MSDVQEKKMQFSPAQQKVIDTRGKNLLVSASAGAGKTAVLVERLCQLVIKDRIPIDAILAMTFTEDAAREMKVRLKDRLSKCDPNDPWISRQISQLETASISTIHSFCLDIVQHYYYLAGLSYSMATTVDNGLADEQAMADALDEAAASLDPKEMADLQVYMDAFSQTGEDLRKLVLKFLETARSKPDQKAWMESCRHVSPQTNPWFFSWFQVRIEALIEIFEGMILNVSDMEFKKAKQKEEQINIFSRKIHALRLCLQALEAQDYKAFRSEFLHGYLQGTDNFKPTINKVSFKTTQSDSRDFEKEIAAVLFDQRVFEEGAKRTQHIQSAFVDLALRAQDAFARRKKEAQFIDFGDMEQFAWKILQNPQAANELRDRYQVILIDEYQDTNDLQEAIIQAIARKNNVFRVGDIKQSIYGFRQARPELMKHHLEHAGSDDEIIAMQENYRSSARLIRFNNEFFKDLMNTPMLPSQFSEIDEAKPGLESQEGPNQPPVRFLFTEYGSWKNPQADPDAKQNANEARRLHRINRYDLIARDIRRKIDTHEIEPRDIAILSRSSTPHEELKNALEAWGILSLHHMKKGFYTNKSVQIVLSALRVIADRRNDIALMAMLCSPLGKQKQSDILPLLNGREEGQSLYMTLCQSEQGLSILKPVFDMRDWIEKPLPEIITSIYAYNNFYTDYTTSQDKTNLDLLLEKAVNAAALMDLDGFLESSHLEEDLDKTSEAIPFAREENAVRISTIHASKGLQYKLVYILSEQTNPDLDARKPVRIDSDLGLSFEGIDYQMQCKERSASEIAFSQKRFFEDLQEKMRLLYVACTRAEKELVFVDTIKDATMYDWDLNTYALLENNGFTSWFFHLRHRLHGLDVRFEEEADLLERPNVGVRRNRILPIRHYHGGAKEITSQTASRKKQAREWPKQTPVSSSGSMEARARGTLIHEIAANLPYPYQKDAIEEYAKRSGISLPAENVREILALNDCAQYAKWMNMEHVFECPYIAREEGAIVHGYMDLAVFDGTEISIIDFKSDRVFTDAVLIERYTKQLDTYAKAMRQIRPEANVHCYIYSFALNKLIPLDLKSA